MVSNVLSCKCSLQVLFLYLHRNVEEKYGKFISEETPPGYVSGSVRYLTRPVE
jgi:hypothetical protein